MQHIPITFENEGKTYNGYFSRVAAAAETSTYQLRDNENYYLGRLRYFKFCNRWVFDASLKTKEFEELATYFN